MFIELWNHGTAGDTKTPCGEVDIFNVTGERIDADILKILMEDTIPSVKFDWFGGLPTEQALIVEVEYENSENGIWLDVVAFSYLPDIET